MPKATTTYRCSSCDSTSARWVGKCPRCNEFGTMQEVAAAVATPGRKVPLQARTPGQPARPVTMVATDGPLRRQPTGIGEFDRVIGGGLVAGQVCLLSGAPGSGKSTLALGIANSVSTRTGQRALYISGEESVQQIALRAQRVGADSPDLLLADDVDLGMILSHVDDNGPGLALVVIDSVQTVASPDVEGRPGGVTQVMEVAQVLTRLAKARRIPMILIGQVTKDSTVAGPRALEHIVDTTLAIEGDKHTSLRLLRTVKNRFGALEVAAFEQTDAGMQEVLDPSVLFREDRIEAVPGTCVTVTVEGNRAIIAEVQALVAPTNSPNPRRAVSGLDSARSAMLIAVSERAAGLRLYDKDVFLATIGGMRLSDPGSDLAACLAIVSASHNALLPLDLAAIGEVSLSGDIRPVPMMAERISEAVRLGYRRLLVPVGSTSRAGKRADGGVLVEVPTLRHAISVM